MSNALSDVRNRIHRKSHEYFTFAYGRRDQSRWRMFYGATDALLDASTAASAFGDAVQSDPAIDLLVCYGFLQAIYIEQDAVLTLARAVGIEKWHPNDNPKLKEIRDLRNRLTGHPAIAGEKSKPKRLSSAIISYDRVRPNSFVGSIYFEDGFQQVVVSVTDILNDNETQLRLQMLEVERVMDEQERKFRMEQSKRLLSIEFGQGFDYLLQRLHCDLNDDGRLGQAEAHLKMICEKLNRLREDLHDRGFATKATDYDFDRIFAGLGILNSVMAREKHVEADQHKFDLVFDGIEKRIQDLRKFVEELDTRLTTPIE
jgi:hypothetical protein